MERWPRKKMDKKKPFVYGFIIPCVEAIFLNLCNLQNTFKPENSSTRVLAPWPVFMAMSLYSTYAYSAWNLSRNYVLKRLMKFHSTWTCGSSKMTRNPSAQTPHAKHLSLHGDSLAIIFQCLLIRCSNGGFCKHCCQHKLWQMERLERNINWIIVRSIPFMTKQMPIKRSKIP